MRTAALATAALLLAALAASEDATPAEAKMGATILSGGDLPRPISIPVEDGFALWFPPGVPANVATFTGWPSRLDTPPESPGLGYSLSSGLEAELLSPHSEGGHALWFGVEFADGRPPTATYYPAVAALEIRMGDDLARWARLDEDRARVLDCYIELGRANTLPEQPSILDVLAAEARTGRMTPTRVDGRPMASEALEAFWRTADRTSWPEVPVFGSRRGAKAHTGAPADYDEAVEAMVFGDATPVWLAFDLDGREVKLAYYPVTGVIAALPLPNSSAWIGRGFVIPPDLRNAFHAALGLPALQPPPAPAEAAPVLGGETRKDPASGGHLEGRTGAATALALVGLAALLAVASATFLRGTRHRPPA